MANDSEDCSQSKPEFISKNVFDELEVVQKTVNDVGTVISNIISKQEEEFLNAYQIHQRQMKEEFQAMKVVIDEKDRQISENEYVKKVEKELEWYRNSSLSLDKLLDKSKLNEQYLKERVSILESEVEGYKKQLKSLLARIHLSRTSARQY